MFYELITQINISEHFSYYMTTMRGKNDKINLSEPSHKFSFIATNNCRDINIIEEVDNEKRSLGKSN